MQTLKLKKVKVPQGKSVRVNLKLSEAALKAFEELRKRKAYKVNAEVFDLLFSQIVDPDQDVSNELLQAFLNESPISKPATRRIFTVNEYTLAKLRKIAKTHNLSLDEIVNRTLIGIGRLISALKRDLDTKKYEDEQYVLKEISEIWSRVTDLRYGLEQVFQQDYDPTDPENLNCWFANIEGGLQELDDLVPNLFKQKVPKNLGASNSGDDSQK